MSKVLQFPTSCRIRRWVPLELDANAEFLVNAESLANAESIVTETEALIIEARARMFYRVFAEIVELVEICEQMISESAFPFRAGIEEEAGRPPGRRSRAPAPREDDK